MPEGYSPVTPHRGRDQLVWVDVATGQQVGRVRSTPGSTLRLDTSFHR